MSLAPCAGRLFLSYRVDADAGLVEQIYYQLRTQGADVWWDKECLPPGQPWEVGFADGLGGGRGPRHSLPEDGGDHGFGREWCL